MRSIATNSWTSRTAWYVTDQSEADRVVRQILHTIRPEEEQIFADTETAPLPEFRHEWGNKQARYQPGLDPFKSYVRLLQVGYGSDVWVFDTHRIKDYSLLRLLLENDDIWKWFHNAKFDYKHLLWSLDIVTSSMVDFLAASRLLNHPEGNLGFLAQHMLGITLDKSVQRTDWGVAELSDSQLTYAAEDVLVEMQLRDPIVKELKKRGLWSAFSIECGALAPAGEMELNGTKLHREKHQALVERKIVEAGELRTQILQGLEPHLQQLALPGMMPGINLNSNDQLLAALQSSGLDIEAVNKTELKLKALDHPLTGTVLAYKAADKAVTGFGGYIEAIHPVTGRIHSDFNGLFAKTFRFSSTNPNLQNIARGPEYRECFVAEDGWQYVMADYAAIEFLGGGVAANDETILNIFRRKLQLTDAKRRGEAVGKVEERLADPHYVTAAIVTGKPIDQIVKEQRQDAKPVNFGFLYGQMPKGFRVFAFVQYERRFTLKQCETIRSDFFSERGYVGLDRWHKTTRNVYKTVPLVETLAGYQIPLQYNPDFDSFAGPAPLNYQVQNPCAAGNKRALKKLWEYCRPYMHKADRWKGPMLCRTVHDENHLEAPEHMAEDAARHLEDCMKTGMDRIFGRDDLVTVEAQIGNSWAAKT